MLAGANSDFMLITRYLHSEGICLCNYFEPDSISESCRILALWAQRRGSAPALHQTQECPQALVQTPC